MNPFLPFWSANRRYDEVLPWLKQQLERAGLRVMQTFDLRLAAPLDQGYCDCPHHGTAQCDCELVVLLLYGSEETPASLILHGNDGQTWLSLVDRPSQPAPTTIVAAVKQAVDQTI